MRACVNAKQRGEHGELAAGEIARCAGDVAERRAVGEHVAEPAVVGRADVDLRQLRERRLRFAAAEVKVRERQSQPPGARTKLQQRRRERHLRRMRCSPVADSGRAALRRMTSRSGCGVSFPLTSARRLCDRRCSTRTTPGTRPAAADRCAPHGLGQQLNRFRAIARAVRVQRQRGQAARLGVAGDVGKAEVVAVVDDLIVRAR